MVDRLLKRGVDSSGADSGGETAVRFAARGGQEQPVDRLLARGAEPNVVGKNCWTALMRAAQGGHLQMVDRLLELEL